MTWVRFDDQTDDHPKIAGLSDSAFRWWFRGFCYSGRYLLDGVLPPTFIARLPKRAGNELVSAGLWEYKDGHLTIHDYHDYQPTKAAVTAKRAKTSDRMKRFRDGVTVSAQTPFVTPSVRELLPAACTTPDPDPQLQRTPQPPAKAVGFKPGNRSDRERAEHVRKLAGQCLHEPSCRNFAACVELGAAYIRAQREGAIKAAS
jgi:hypothetical protein